MHRRGSLFMGFIKLSILWEILVYTLIMLNNNTNNIYLYRANSTIQFSNAPENCIVISTLSSRKSTTIVALTKIVF